MFAVDPSIATTTTLLDDNDEAVLKQRVRSVALLEAALASSPSSSSPPLATARDIEGYVYATSLERGVDYSAKVLQLAYNLQKNGNFLLSTYAPDVLVHIDDKLLAEGTDVAAWWTGHTERLSYQSILLHQESKFDETEQLGSTGLTCNRCHSRHIAIHQQQIRSADEGMTVFCTCKKCGMRWKM